MRMPDITLAQVLAVVGWGVAQAVAYGWLSSEQSQLVMSAGATIIAAAWKLADGMIRTGRNNARAAALAAGQPDPARK